MNPFRSVKDVPFWSANSRYALCRSDVAPRLTYALKTILSNTRNSVVSVAITVFSPGGSRYGSGVFVSTDGYILTSAHLLSGDRSQMMVNVVAADNRGMQAKVIGVDEATGLAMLKVDGDGFAPVHFSSRVEDLAQSGSTVIGIAYSNGQGAIPFVGQVSSLYSLYITFTAPQIAGEVGGPLLDNDGDVVGLITLQHDYYPVAIRSNIILGFLKKYGF
jgi:serine protease Do